MSKGHKPMTLRTLCLAAMAVLMSGTLCLGQTKPAAPAAASPVLTLPGAVPSSWDGRWSGSFGARSDMVVTIARGTVSGVALLGQPLVVTTSSVSGDSVTAGGPDFSLTLRKVAPTNAQGTYENNRKEKASALFSRN
jgi:hypothetical protein